MDKELSSDPWMHHMCKGTWEEAWKICDNVLEERRGKSCCHLPRHLQYVWSGAPLDGKRVLVRCYHGLGDTIQFLRFIPLLQQIATEVILWIQPSLIPLVKRSGGNLSVLPLHDGPPGVAYDVDVEIMELVHVFRVTPASLPAGIPYLTAEPVETATGNPLKKVGLVWEGSDWDPQRNIPPGLLMPLFRVRDVQMVILQQAAETKGWKQGLGLHPGELNMEALAGVMLSLDLVISVDSMPAHLAGALGVPVWTLLKAEADWRWMTERSDSPWYPTMRLFRQHRQDRWQEVIEQVVEAITEHFHV